MTRYTLIEAQALIAQAEATLDQISLLVDEDEDARASLRRVYAHLADLDTLLWLTEPAPPAEVWDTVEERYL
jgi:anti-sigma-K factor RskA